MISLFTDEFALRATLTGLALALATGPLGCFVVWRRMAYFGDALSHSALLGVALGIVAGVAPIGGVLVVGVFMAVLFTALQSQQRFGSDTILGLLAHSALAFGLVALSFAGPSQIDLMGYLFGDLLAVSRAEVWQSWLVALLVLGGLAVIWRPLLALTVQEELAAAAGIRPFLTRLVFTLLLAATVAIAMRVVGIILVTAMLIIPAAAARRFAVSPEGMALLAALAGMAAVLGGLTASFTADTPAGPSIVLGALVLFLLSQAAGLLVSRLRTAA